jgi:hypothetical protein
MRHGKGLSKMCNLEVKMNLLKFKIKFNSLFQKECGKIQASASVRRQETAAKGENHDH